MIEGSNIVGAWSPAAQLPHLSSLVLARSCTPSADCTQRFKE